MQPRSPYSASKAGSDLIALAYAETHDLAVMVTRSSNQYGPFQFPEKLIPYLTTSLLRGQSVPVYGDGLQVRDWLHVEDNCRALELVLEEGEAGEIYNISASEERTNLSVVTALLDLLDADHDRIDHVEDRLGHDRRYSIHADKIQALGWAPERSFDEALAETVSWYQEHAAWWEPLLRRVRNR